MAALAGPAPDGLTPSDKVSDSPSRLARKKAPPKRGLEVGGPRLAIANPRWKACRTRP
jgi:hypothetical protein